MLVEIKKFGKEERAVCTSLDVAETFTYFSEDDQKQYTREHKAILRAIRELKCSTEFRGEHFSPSNYVDSRGKIQPCVLIDRDGFTFLVMGFNDPKSVKYKEAYIKRFNAMESELRVKLIEREKSIVARNSMTKSLQQSAEDERMHGHAYSTYTNCIYKVLFGMNANQLREKYGIEKNVNLRDHFTGEELRAIQSMEHLVSGLVGCGWEYEMVKSFVEHTNAQRQLSG